MRHVVLLLALAGTAAANAQVYKCLDAGGKVTLTERPCEAGQTSARQDRLSTELTPEQRRQAMAESKDRAASDRRAAMELMIRDGRAAEAQAMARTPEERALASQAVAAQARQAKEARRAEESRVARERTEDAIKRMKKR